MENYPNILKTTSNLQTTCKIKRISILKNNNKIES
jgi:hypothetical protein